MWQAAEITHYPWKRYKKEWKGKLYVRELPAFYLNIPPTGLATRLETNLIHEGKRVDIQRHAVRLLVDKQAKVTDIILGE